MPGYDYFYTLQEICVLLNLLPNTFRQIAREYPDIIVVREQVRKGGKVVGLPRAEFETFRAIVEMRGQGLSREEIRARLTGTPVAAGGDGQAGPIPAAAARADDGPGPEALAPGPAETAPGPLGTASGRVETDSGPVETAPGRLEGVSGPAETAPGPERVRPFDGHETGAALSRGEREAAATAEPSLPSPAGRPGSERAMAAAERVLAAEIASLKEELRRMDERRREERDRLLTALIRTQHELQSLRYEVGVSLSRRDRKKRRGFWSWLFDL